MLLQSSSDTWARVAAPYPRPREIPRSLCSISEGTRRTRWEGAGSARGMQNKLFSIQRSQRRPPCPSCSTCLRGFALPPTKVFPILQSASKFFSVPIPKMGMVKRWFSWFFGGFFSTEHVCLVELLKEKFTCQTHFLTFSPPGVMLGTGRKIHCNSCNWTGLVIQMRFPYLAASLQKDPPLCRSGNEKRPGPGNTSQQVILQTVGEESSVFGVLLPFCKMEIIEQNPNKWDVLVQPLHTPLCM